MLLEHGKKEEKHYAHISLCRAMIVNFCGQLPTNIDELALIQKNHLYIRK